MKARRPPAFSRRKRGSILIVAMLLAGIIGISLVSYLNLTRTALKTATRSFYSNASVDIAEIGIEQAMACFYQISIGTASATAWSGWTLSGNDATRTFSGFTPGPGTTAVVRVYVHYYTMSGTPVIVAKSTITPPDGPTINKWIEVTLTPRGLFALGMVARNTISFTGNATVDSWNSDPDNNSATAAIVYSNSTRNTNGSVGSVSTTNGAIDIGNGSVFGYVDSGGGSLSHGPNGVVSGSFSGSGIDTSRVSTDFSATFPSVTTPSPTTVNTIATSPSAGTSFPRVGDSMNASDSKYYYNFNSGASVSLSGSNTITVAGNCIWMLNSHAASTAISTSGNGEITINSGASLVVYTNGNISHTGNGFMNNNTQPSACLIYGTYTGASTQSITLTGNGSGGAAIYAPNSTFTCTGNGTLNGAVVAYNISMTGNATFHYDESLANLNASAGVHVSKWKELQSATDRATYASELNF